MKKFFNTIGICIGLPLLFFFVSGIIPVISILIIRNNDVYAQNIYAIIALSDLILLALLYVIFLPSDEGFISRIKFNKINIKDSINIFILGIGLSIVSGVLGSILNRLLPKNLQSNLSSSGVSILSLISVVILIPICEELFFRGIIFGFLKKNYNIIVAIIAQAFIFAFAHFNLVQSTYTFILGIVLGLIYVKFKSIKGSILLHMAFNFLGMIVLPKLGSNNYIFIGLISLALVCIVFSSLKITKTQNESLTF